MNRYDIKDGERIEGTIKSTHLSEGKYGGTFGEIIDDSGNDYTYDNSHMFRNFSRAIVGARVSFEVISYSYATHIDQIDKHDPKWKGAKYH